VTSAPRFDSAGFDSVHSLARFAHALEQLEQRHDRSDLLMCHSAIAFAVAGPAAHTCHH
jgi:hypothetical protein